MNIEAIFKLREERDNQNKDGSDAVEGAVGGTAASVGAAANSYRRVLCMVDRTTERKIYYLATEIFISITRLK